MDNTQKLTELRAIRKMIDDLIAELEGAAPGAPPGMVAVHPTGVLANGVVRYYPVFAAGEPAWSYASRLQTVTNPTTGRPYMDPALLGGMIMFPWNKNATPADELDRFLHNKDWWTQAEVDRYNTLSGGGGFSPGPPPTNPPPIEVPVG